MRLRMQGERGRGKKYAAALDHIFYLILCVCTCSISSQGMYVEEYGKDMYRVNFEVRIQYTGRRCYISLLSHVFESTDQATPDFLSNGIVEKEGIYTD